MRFLRSLILFSLIAAPLEASEFLESPEYDDALVITEGLDFGAKEDSLLLKRRIRLAAAIVCERPGAKTPEIDACVAGAISEAETAALVLAGRPRRAGQGLTSATGH